MFLKTFGDNTSSFGVNNSSDSPKLACELLFPTLPFVVNC